MKPLFVAAICVTALFTVSCKPSKDQMKKAFVKSCIAEASKAVPDKSEKTTKALAEYCDCAGQKVIDQFSVAELERLDKNPNDTGLTKKIEPIIASCVETLGKKLSQ